jgi:integrase/recombinase XerD
MNIVPNCRPPSLLDLLQPDTKPDPALPETEDTDNESPLTPIRLRNRFAPPTVKVYARHSAKCPHHGDRNYRGCKCLKWIYCYHDGKSPRFSAKTRSWTQAEKLQREIQDSLDPMQAELNRLKNIQQSQQIPIQHAIEAFLSDVAARRLAPRTQRNYSVALTVHLASWTEKNRIRFLSQLTTPQLTRWRSTWTGSSGTAQLHREVVSTFLNFCVQQDWMPRNPARYLTKMQHRRQPTDYFTPQQFEYLLRVAASLASRFNYRRAVPQRRRLLPLVVALMRSSGLAIRDAVFLERSRLINDNLFLYRSKTGEPVYVLLEKKLAAALRSISVGWSNARYFFWNGEGDVESVLGAWHREFRKLFRVAAIRNPDGSLKRCHSHMLRDTFAVELVLAGVPTEEVAVLLGHSSLRTTERHYLPWVRARQEKLERSVRMAHLASGITKSTFVTGLLEAMNVGDDKGGLFDSRF